MSQLKKVNYVQSSRMGSHHTYALTVEGERIAAQLYVALPGAATAPVGSHAVQDGEPTPAARPATTITAKLAMAATAKPPPAVTHSTSVAKKVTVDTTMSYDSCTAMENNSNSNSSIVIDLTEDDSSQQDEEQLSLFERVALRQAREQQSRNPSLQLTRLVPAAVTTITQAAARPPKIARISSSQSVSSIPYTPSEVSLSASNSVSSNSAEEVDWSAFVVVMLLDNRELGREAADRQYLLSHLRARSVNIEVRDLSLGDVMWVAKHRISGIEYVLDCIVERKTPADLAESIRDGRYREQRLRLRGSKLTQVFYLIEGDVRKEERCAELGLPKALCTLQFVDGFTVHEARTPDASIAFLSRLHHILSQTIRSSVHSPLVTYTQFKSLTAKTKNTTMQQLFGKMLLNIRRVSADAAELILARYPTLCQLLEAYDDLPDEKSCELMLKDIQRPSGLRLGEALSTAVYRMMCDMTYNDV